MTKLLDNLLDWLRIPSISTGGGDPADLQKAAEWAATRVRGAGGTAELVTIDGGNPLVVGDLARRAGAPTSSSTGTTTSRAPATCPVELAPVRAGDPRRAPLRARRLRRQGQLPPAPARRLRARARRALPVNVRVLVEGEEEAASHAVAQWIRADERRADCAIVFD